MAFTLENGVADAMSLKDFIETVGTTLDPRDSESIKECGKYLYSLSLNSKLFDNIIVDAVKTQASSRGLQESFNGYREMTFLLGKSADSSFFVRANVWKPPKAVVGSLDLQNGIYSYNLAHDHNFDFVTVGYFGSGYSTHIYEYDHRKVHGKIGEHVDLTFLEDTTLPVGKVMMYRKSIDIHTQLPPADTSISINLMVQPPAGKYREQYCFDIAESAIAGHVEGPINYQVSLLSLAASLGGNELIDPLLAIANHGISGRTRAAAIDAVLEISPDLCSTVLAQCGADQNPLVASSLSKLRQLGQSQKKALPVP